MGVSPGSTELALIADSLKDEFQTGFHRDRPRSYERYVHLRKNELFDRLCTLYESQFRAQWHRFKHIIEVHRVLKDGYASHPQYAAACYVSAWFRDLYVSNRKCVEKLSFFGEYYLTHQDYCCGEFDPFLQHLNAVIRPTHVQLSLEDTVYIPVITSTIDWTHKNPFDIRGYTFDARLVGDLRIAVRNNWKIVQLSREASFGRPMWLFDWKDGEAYTFFPEERNFSKDDLVAAHILGIPITPRLGARDSDDWQFFPDNVVPAVINPSALNRVVPRSFYGSAEYRTIITREWILPSEPPAHPTEEGAAKRPREGEEDSPSAATPAAAGTGVADLIISTPAEAPPPLIKYHQFKIIDWCYHARVVLDLNSQKQRQALRSFLFHA